MLDVIEYAAKALADVILGDHKLLRRVEHAHYDTYVIIKPDSRPDGTTSGVIVNPLRVKNPPLEEAV